MSKKLFWRNQMASESVGSLLVSGRFYSGNEVAEVYDGALVEIGHLEPHAYYDGVTDLNVRKVKFPSAVTKRVGIVDVSNRSEGYINGVLYREGSKTTDLTIAAGTPARVRLFGVGDSFSIGSGNIIGTPAVGKYLIPTLNDGRFTVSNEAKVDSLCCYIEAEMPLTEGVVNTDKKYLCTVENIVA